MQIGCRSRLWAAFLLTAVWAATAQAHAACQSPESVVAWYDHNQIEAAFTPLYGLAAILAIARLNEILPGTGIEGDALLIVEEPGEPVFYAYLYRDNCQLGAAWVRLEFLKDVIGGGV